MFAPVRAIVSRLHQRGFCDPFGKPTSKVSWTVLDDDQIIRLFDSILRRILNYYGFIDCFSRLTRIQYILPHSAAKALARRHRSKVRTVFSERGNTLRTRLPDGLFVSLEIRHDWKSDTKRFHTGAWGSGLPGDILTMQIRLRTRSKLRSPCVICWSNDKVVMHHVRYIRKMGKSVRGFDRILARSIGSRFRRAMNVIGKPIVANTTGSTCRILPTPQRQHAGGELAGEPCAWKPARAVREGAVAFPRGRGRLLHSVGSGFESRRPQFPQASAAKATTRRAPRPPRSRAA